MEERRRVTLYDQMTAGNSSSSSRVSLAGLFLNDVVLANQNSKDQNRTLLDIIREDDVVIANNNTKDRKSWKAFKDKLRLWRVHIPASDTPIPTQNNNNRTPLSQPSQINSVQSQTPPDLDALSSQQQNDVVEDPVAVAAQDAAADPVSMSLLDLLEETDGELGFEMDLYRMSDDDDDGDGDGDGVDECEKGEEEEEGVVKYNCCVCMVRHKGAAFIPCGHTFCRMCSREVWVTRGNCPLCNNSILEILDIF